MSDFCYGIRHFGVILLNLALYGTDIITIDIYYPSRVAGSPRNALPVRVSGIRARHAARTVLEINV